eukprot:TRINITY_DN42118_c0_g1_i1.p1 TRINITY_DN42118_c0_g1~~TRINITY_DN42118_c0_g1_i1.p1  ORF type:complete len:309 (+),score=83.06 TRINITY_DN42118_c0_g1_i1:92-1018(+)
MSYSSQAWTPEQLRAALEEANAGIRLHEVRSAQLSAEGRETAAFCSVLSERFDKQVDLNGKLWKRLEESEAQVRELRCEIRELQRGESKRAEGVAEKEAAVLKWEANRLKELPILKGQLLAEAEKHRQQLEEQVHRHIATSDQHFNAQARELMAELDHARRDNALLGRKCCASYEATQRAELAAQHWQQQSGLFQQELRMANAERLRLLEEIKWQHGKLVEQEQIATKLQSQLEHAESQTAFSEEASQELRSWVVKSLNEVNRSAHPQGELRRARVGQMSANDWVGMLESFRSSQQTRNGFGNRTRSG